MKVTEITGRNFMKLQMLIKCNTVLCLGNEHCMLYLFLEGCNKTILVKKSHCTLILSGWLKSENKDGVYQVSMLSPFLFTGVFDVITTLARQCNK